MYKQRRTDISILKGIGILLMVIGHSGAPTALTRFIYEFHMPLFFIVSGYFFSSKQADAPWQYVANRFNGLYIPFLKWGVLFLFLHNVFHTIGILTPLSDNGSYSFPTIVKRTGQLIFTMSGYEPHILGAFWFLRALFIASLLLVGSYWLLKKIRWLTSPSLIIAIIALVSFLLTFYLQTYHIRLAISQGGYRESVGLLFLCLGFLFRQYETRLPRHCLFECILWAIVVVFSVYAPSTIGIFPGRTAFLSILLPGFCGWMATYFLSQRLVCSPFARPLSYLGDHSLYILALHFLSFKLVNIIKIYALGLDWNEMGRHVLPKGTWPGGWIAYTIVGITLPLWLEWGWKHLKKTFMSTEQQTTP